MNPSHSNGVPPLSGDAVDLAAAQWQVRRQDGLTAAEEARFQAWLAAHAGHRAAYARFDRVWAGLGELPPGAVGRLKAPPRPGRPAAASAAAAAAATAASGARGRPSRWFGLMRPLATAALAVTVAAGGALGWRHWQARPLYSESFATARGQQLNVALPDGSTLGLDTATRVEVTLYRDRREVRLPEGQALFTVKADAGRPFQVRADRVLVTVVGTRFSVRNTRTGLGPDGVGVRVEEGRVRVATAGQAGAAALLTAGQTIESDAAGRLAPVRPAPPGGAMPWREGRVDFDGTPLDQAVAEFERYGATGLAIRDPAVAALRVSGSFDLRQAGAFSATLPLVLPVQLRSRGGRTEIIAKNSK
nr:FecR domain-containing protein [uncultured Duganella sp.]